MKGVNIDDAAPDRKFPGRRDLVLAFITEIRQTLSHRIKVGFFSGVKFECLKHKGILRQR